MSDAIYQVDYLYIELGDSFTTSYGYRDFGYVNEDDASWMEKVRVGKIEHWPQCHMEGWPMFYVHKVRSLEHEKVMEWSERYLRDLKRKSN
jgi:hypothetical protein